jgi:tripartite-type tricarboxylate transporter receptor subunit TctC
MGQPKNTNAQMALGLQESTMKLSRRKFLHLAAGPAVLPSVSRFARAQTYPTRPVTMVVPYPAGAGVDVLGRILAPRLSEQLGQQVIVENVGGTGGMAGSARVARAAPDGYSFVLGNTGTHAQNQTLYKSPLYNAATDFAPVLLIAETPQVLVARRDLPADKLRDFIAYAKINHAKMQFGSAGAGSPGHLTCALFNAAIGVSITHVPYRGAAPALQDLIAGRIDYLCTIAATVIPQFAGRTIKGIANLSRNRSPSLPELQSADEQGLADFDASTWQGFFMPKGTPTAMVHKLHDATVAAMNIPAVRDRLREIGNDPVAPERQSPEYLQRFVEGEIRKWAPVIRAAGISAD